LRGRIGVQLVQQRRESIAKQLMRLDQSAALAEGRVIEIVRLDAQAGGDVVAGWFFRGALLNRFTSTDP
jgi:hypothetical protein